MGIKSLFCYFKNEGKGFLKFLREASTGQPWDQETPEAANICYWHCGICKMKRPRPSLIIPLACDLQCRSNVSHLSVTFSSAIPPGLNSRAKQLEMRTLTTLWVTLRDLVWCDSDTVVILLQVLSLLERYTDLFLVQFDNMPEICFKVTRKAAGRTICFLSPNYTDCFPLKTVFKILYNIF